MAFLVELVELLVGAARAADLVPGQQQVLQEALHLMRDVCARDDSGRGLVGAGGSSASSAQEPSLGADLVAELQAAGAVPTLLAMLKALEPIQNPQQQRMTANGGVLTSSSGGSSGGIQLAELAPQLAASAARFSFAPPYPGFRSDLLAVLANAAHGRTEVQASTARGGMTGCMHRSTMMPPPACPAYIAVPCCLELTHETSATVPRRAGVPPAG